MKNTVNYGLNMPDLDDFYNINDFNENAETIDNVMHENELAINALSENTQTALDGVSEKIGNTNDTGATDNTGTVMGKLNSLLAGGGGIKNVQSGAIHQIVKPNSEIKVDANFASYRYIDFTISAVNLTKTFVIVSTPIGLDERPSTHFTCGRLINETTLRIYANSGNNNGYRLDAIYWQVIEFY